MKIIVYTPKYRDDLIFMVLAAKDALGRVPTLNGDLLDLDGAYFSKGDCFWIMLDERDRVVGSVGCNLLPDGEAVIHRLYVKADLKRRALAPAFAGGRGLCQSPRQNGDEAALGREKQLF